MREYAIFLHSTGTGPFLFDKPAPKELFGSVTKLAPTNLGYPPLPLLPRGEHVTVLNDAEHVLRSIPADAERIHLFAHSYGGLIAQKIW
ncbi:MAG: alpha/beta fold hydrolase, partial [Myxococcaceae bacterium]